MARFVPQTISWNLTRLCNLGCGHCYLDAQARAGERRDELDTAQCLRVVDQIRRLSPECLLILTGGEPLLRKDLIEICEHASQAGLWVVVGTNGTRLTPRMAERLKVAGVKGVGISLDSLDPGTHDRFRGRAGAWAGAVAGLEAARRAELDAVVQVSLFSWNLGEIEALADFSLEQGARAVNFYLLVCTGRGQGQTGLGPAAAEAVYARLYTLQGGYRGRLLVSAKCAPQFQRFIHRQNPESPHLRAFQGGCPAATSYLRIEPRGEVTPCPYIPAVGGNLKHRPLEEIWAGGEPFVMLRDREGLAGRCGACEYRALCGGCRARALAEYGDLLAEDPSCAYQPAPSPGAAIELPDGATYFQEVEKSGQVPWTPEAQAILARIPPFVRGMVKSRMESHAAREGIPEITAEMLRELREKRMASLRAGK